jgi:hypothetical protein
MSIALVGQPVSLPKKPVANAETAQVERRILRKWLIRWVRLYRKAAHMRGAVTSAMGR